MINGSTSSCRRTTCSELRSPHSPFSTGCSRAAQTLHESDRHFAEDSEVPAKTVPWLDGQRNQAGARRHDFTRPQRGPMLRQLIGQPCKCDTRIPEDIAADSWPGRVLADASQCLMPCEIQ